MTSNYDPTRDIVRPPKEIIEALSVLDTDSVTSTMDGLGVHRTFIEGPIARVPGSKICGPALTLRFVPQREDQMRGYEIPGESDEDGDVQYGGGEREALRSLGDLRLRPARRRDRRRWTRRPRHRHLRRDAHDLLQVVWRSGRRHRHRNPRLRRHLQRGQGTRLVDRRHDRRRGPHEPLPRGHQPPHRLRQGARPSGRHHHGRRRRARSSSPRGSPPRSSR